ncbi:MAG: amino acid ABC transporter permease [Alphaproteobacteria bacterium]
MHTDLGSDGGSDGPGARPLGSLTALRRWLGDEAVRQGIIQALTAAAVVAGLFFLAQTFLENAERRGLALGFGFLDETAGFDIADAPIPYSAETSTYARAVAVGALNTLRVSLLGIGAATVLGAVLGVLRLSGNWLVARLVSVYVEVFRNLPLLLQILFWYSVIIITLPKVRESLSVGGVIFLNNRGLELPKILFGPGAWWIALALVAGGIGTWAWGRAARRYRLATGRHRPVWPVALAGLVVLPFAAAWAAGWPWAVEVPEFRRFNFQGGMSLSPPLFALWFALTVYTAAFIAEIVRAGIQSVDEGQREAALALGLSRGLTLRMIILPQALRVIIPPTTSQYLNLTKNSSLAIFVGYPDIFAVVGETINSQTGQPFEALLILLAFYLTVSLLISLAMNLYNRSIAIREG